MKKLIWIYLLILLSFIMSCSKEAFDNNGLDGLEAYATIVDAGVGAADGCGWMLQINDEYVHPENLPIEFQENGLDVYICYSLRNDSFYCGIAAIPYQSIDILNIYQQNRNCLPIHTYNSNTYSYHTDAITINEITIISNCLQIDLSYSGGCKTHEFLLFADLSIPDLSFKLAHNANDDPCEAWLTTTISYDLSPFKNPDSSSVGFFVETNGYRKYFEYIY